jgi:hypothetical protein
LIVYDDPRVADYLAEKLQTTLHPPFVTIGLARNGAVVAGGLFNIYTGPDIQLTIAAERGCVTRGLLRAWKHYVIEQSGCLRVTIETEQPAVVDMALRLGGKIEGIKRHLFGLGRDGYVVGILGTEWRL